MHGFAIQLLSVLLYIQVTPVTACARKHLKLKQLIATKVHYTERNL